MFVIFVHIAFGSLQIFTQVLAVLLLYASLHYRSWYRNPGAIIIPY